MVSKFLEVPGLEALQPPVLLPPRINTYKPEVERWRQQAWDHMPAQLKNRADAGRLLDKYLYVMQGESGGRDTVMHDGGNGYGLMADRVSRTPVGSSADTQIKNAWKLVANNPDKWTDWGEGALYQGKPFGVLGATPYGNAIKPPSTGDAGGAPSDYLQPGVNPLASGPRGKSLSDYLEAGRQQDAQQEDPLAPLDTGFRLPTPEPTMTVQVGQSLGPTATPAPAPPQTPQQVPGPASPPWDVNTGDVPMDLGPYQEAWAQANAGDVPVAAYQKEAAWLNGPGPEMYAQANAGDVPVAANRLREPSTPDMTYVDPSASNTFRGELEAKRQGESQYGRIPEVVKQKPLDIAALAAIGIAPTVLGPTAGATPALEAAGISAPAVAGGLYGAATAAVSGVPVIGGFLASAPAATAVSRPIQEALHQIPGYDSLPEWVKTVVELAPFTATGKEALVQKITLTIGSGIGMYEGAKIDDALGLHVPGVGGPFALAGGLAGGAGGHVVGEHIPTIAEVARKAFTPDIKFGEAAYPTMPPPGGGLEAEVRAAQAREEARQAAEAAKKPLPGQTGMFGETVDAAGQIAPMEGVPAQRTLPVESDPARGEFGRQSEAFPDPNAGAQPGLMTEGTRTPGAIDPSKLLPVTRVEPAVLGGAGEGSQHRIWADPQGNLHEIKSGQAHPDALADGATMADAQRAGWVRVGLNPGRDGNLVLYTEGATEEASARAAANALHTMTPEDLAKTRVEIGVTNPDNLSDSRIAFNGPAGEWLKGHPGGSAVPASPMHAAAPPPAPKPPQPTAPSGDIGQETQTVKVSDLTYHPDLFQQRDVPSGAPADPTRVNQIVRGWNDKQFQPPSVVPDPDNPGKYIVYNGHHRTEAYRIVKGNDANIDVIVTKADIKDPEQLRQIRIDAAADNYTQAPTNFREQVRTARSLTDEGVDAAEKMRLTPSRVADLLDADRLGPQAIERVAQDKSLEPYAIEYGRAMRQHGISTEDANGLFNRLADASKTSRPTPASVRETMDKFGGLLKQQRAAEAQGAGMFGADTGQFAGFRGEMLTLMDEYARKQDALKKEIRALERNVKGVRQLAAGASPADRQLAAEANATFKAIGEGKIERLKAELAHNEENLNRAARGEAPVPYEAPAAEPPRDNLAFETPPGSPRAPGGAPPDGGVPPPPGRPPAGDDPAVDVLNQTIEAGGAVAPAARRANHMDLSGRVAAADEMRLKLMREGVAPADAMAQSHAALAGAMQQASFATPAELAAHLPELHKRIATAPVSYFTKNAGHEALDKLAQGIFPMAKSLGNLNHGLRALGEVFGPRTLTALEDLSDVLRLEKDTLEKLLREPIKFPGTSGPLTPEAVGELLAKQIRADAEISERVAGRIVDAGQLRISRGPEGPEITTAGGHERGLQGVIEDFIDEMPDATWDEPGMGPVRGLGGPKTEFPPDYPHAANDFFLPREEGPRNPLEANAPSPADRPLETRSLENAGPPWQGAQPAPGPSLAEARLDQGWVPRDRSRRDAAGNVLDRDRRGGEETHYVLEGPNGEVMPIPDRAQYEDLRNQYRERNRGEVDPNAPVPAPGKLEPFGPLESKPGEESGVYQPKQAGFGWKPGMDIRGEALRVFGDVLTLPWHLLTGLDYSYPFRQGGLAIRQAVRYEDGRLMAGPWTENFVKGLKSMASEEYALKRMSEIERGKWAQFKGEVHVSPITGGASDAEEAFISRLIGKIPVLRDSARAVTVFINGLRSDMVDNFIRSQLRGGEFPKQELIDDYARYVNRSTGYGNLGQFEDSVGLLNQVFFSARRNVSLLQAPMYIFSKNAAVRKEAMYDFVTFFGVGVGTLKLAELMGADVSLNPMDSDFGKIKIGPTRIDVWGGYQQMARLVAKMSVGLATGEEDDSKEAMLTFLQQKLSPMGGTLVDVLRGQNILGQKMGTATPLGDFGSVGNEAYRRLVPLAMQGLIDGIAQDGARGGLLALPGFLGVGTQSYVSPADARDQVAVRDYGVRFDQLDTVSERDKVNKSPEVLKVQNPSELKIKNDQRKAAIDAKEKGYEDGFKAGALDKPLPEYYRDISIERQAHREDFQADFKAELDQIDQPGFQKAVNGYYDIKSEDLYGQPGFDVQAAKRQEYLDKLSTTVEPGRRHSDRQVMDDYLTWVEGRKSPMRQEYDAYIAQRKALGYYDEKLNTMSSGERAVALRNLDVKNPQMDVDNWYWKGGLKDASLAPRLNSTAGVDLALKKAPDRPVQLSGLTRPINQNEQSLKMWKDSQKMVSWYQNDLVPQNQESYAQRTYRKSWDKLTEAQQTSIKGRIVDDTLTANPQLNAVLVWWGHGDTFHSYASGAEFDKLKKTYGSEAWEKGKPAKPLHYTTDAR